MIRWRSAIHDGVLPSPPEGDEDDVELEVLPARTRTSPMPVTQVIERLLLPQHGVLRARLAAVRRITEGRPRARGSGQHERLHLAWMVDELAALILDDLDREEREVYPRLAAGDVATHQLAELHYHHGELEERTARLRDLIGEQGRHPDAHPDVLDLHQRLVELATLLERHHGCENAALVGGHG